MKHPNDDTYSQWLKDKRAQKSPDGFTDTVMATVSELATTRTQRHRQFEGVTFWAKAALLTLAAIVGISRYGLLVLCLLSS